MPSFVVPALGLVLTAAGCGGRSYLQSARALPPGTSRVTVSTALASVQVGDDNMPALNPAVAVRHGLATGLEVTASAWLLGGVVGFKTQVVGEADGTGLAVAVGAAGGARKTAVYDVDYTPGTENAGYSYFVVATGEANLTVSTRDRSGQDRYLVLFAEIDRTPERAWVWEQVMAGNAGVALGVAGPRWSFEFGLKGDGLGDTVRGQLALGRSF